ncbi:MAG: mannitol/fructose-specific phosphotransferase system IIA component (Ntr-type) [Planctomycetota bacterium]|jgi:mannitol/fructose-specific phosphotransferase system IIA component (Ntr-type)
MAPNGQEPEEFGYLAQFDPREPLSPPPRRDILRPSRNREKTLMYQLSELLPGGRIIQLEDATKPGALQSLLDSLTLTKAIKERVAVEEAILSREVLMSTGVGYGIAIPHARLGTVENFAIALGISQAGIDYGSVIDDKPVKLICMIVGPNGQHDDYLKILAMLMRFLKSERGKILSAYTLGEVHGFTQTYNTSVGGPKHKNPNEAQEGRS